MAVHYASHAATRRRWQGTRASTGQGLPRYSFSCTGHSFGPAGSTSKTSDSTHLPGRIRAIALTLTRLRRRRPLWRPFASTARAGSAWPPAAQSSHAGVRTVASLGLSEAPASRTPARGAQMVLFRASGCVTRVGLGRGRARDSRPTAVHRASCGRTGCFVSTSSESRWPCCQLLGLNRHRPQFLASEQQLDDEIRNTAAEGSQPLSPPGPILATPPGTILVLIPSPHMTSPAVHFLHPTARFRVCRVGPITAPPASSPEQPRARPCCIRRDAAAPERCR